MDRILNKRIKGFTLIELLVVIAMLGILVLMALPKFKGHIEKAHLANIQNDVKIAEGLTEEYLINDNKLPDDWESVNIDELTQPAQDKKLYDVKGLVVDEIEEDEYVRLTKGTINSKLKGNFYANQGGKVYYEDIKMNNVSDEPIEKPVDKDELINEKVQAEALDKNLYENWLNVQNAIDNANIIINNDNATQQEVDDILIILKQALQNLVLKLINKDELLAKIEEAENCNDYDYENWSDVEIALKEADIIIKTDNVIQKEVDDATNKLKNAIMNLKKIQYVLATDADFSGTKNPDYTINDGFKYIGTDKYVEIPHVIKGVSVTKYDLMFENTNVLGVKSTNTNITSMRAMFQNSKSPILNLSNLNTSNVDTMEYMMSGAQATNLYLNNFNTNKVTCMVEMFLNNQASILDLSSFDTSNLDSDGMNAMFVNSKITTGYARTQTDADVFNNSESKPIGLTFVVKSK